MQFGSIWRNLSEDLNVRKWHGMVTVTDIFDIFLKGKKSCLEKEKNTA